MVSRLVTLRLHRSGGNQCDGRHGHDNVFGEVDRGAEAGRRRPILLGHASARSRPAGESKWEAFFVVQYRVKGTGRRRRVALGRYGALTLDEARERARKYVSAGLDGEDLYDKKQAQARRPTLESLAEQWLELHVRPKRAPRTVDDYEQVLRLYLRPALGGRIVEEIRRSEVLALHGRMEATPKVADYSLVVGKAIVNFGLKSGFLPEGMSNPFAGVELYGYEGRERFLSEAEVVRIGDALAALEVDGKVSPWAAAALRLLIFTGARKAEILTLQWEWVNLDQSALLLPTSKTGKRRITLNAAAIEVLRGLPRVRGNPHVIVGQKPGSHMISLAAPWRLVCEKAKIVGCRIHDLRHSYASFAAGDGLSLQMIGKLLGHKVPATTARYAHLAEDALRRANERLGTRLGRLLKGQIGVDQDHTSGNKETAE
jgi:integrase